MSENNKSLYAVDKLMEETRRIAAEYHKLTKKSLPLSAELARYDAMRLLELEKPEASDNGIDAIGKCEQRANKRIQIKGRVIFGKEKSNSRIGQLNLEAEWDLLILVSMNEAYEAIQIHEAEKQAIVAALNETSSSSRKKRGAMSMARFKAISNLVWSLS